MFIYVHLCTHVYFMLYKVYTLERSYCFRIVSPLRFPKSSRHGPCSLFLVHRKINIVFSDNIKNRNKEIFIPHKRKPKNILKQKRNNKKTSKLLCGWTPQKPKISRTTRDLNDVDTEPQMVIKNFQEPVMIKFIKKERQRRQKNKQTKKKTIIQVCI